MFDEAAGQAGAAGIDAAANIEVNTGAQTQVAAEEKAEKIIYGKQEKEPVAETHLASGENKEVNAKSLEERQAEFEALIKGEYKDLYDGRVQGIINRRFSDAKNMEKQVKSANEITNLLSMKYGVNSDDIEGLKKAIEEDDTYWEDAAEKANLSVEQFKHMKKMETEITALRRAQEEAERITQKEQIFSKWNQEAEGLKNFYPGFDLDMELRNENFLNLLGAGIDMKTTFETIHHDELMTGAMSYTAQQVAKKQADAIKSGQMRPTENGISSRAAVTVKKDPNTLTHQDFVEIRRQVQNGKRIEF